MARKQTTDLEIDVARIQEREKANAEWKIEVNGNFEKLNQKVDELPDLLIKKLDERYASKEEVAEIKETVDPLTKLRRRVWYLLVGAFVAEAFIFLVMTTKIENILK